MTNQTNPGRSFGCSVRGASIAPPNSRTPNSTTVRGADTEPNTEPNTEQPSEQRLSVPNQEPRKTEPSGKPQRAPAPAIGLRLGQRTSGERYLSGIAPQAFTIEAGARVQLRRVHADNTDGIATHVIVFAPADPRTGAPALTKAFADAAWLRTDPRDATDGGINPMTTGRGAAAAAAAADDASDDDAVAGASTSSDPEAQSHALPSVSANDQ